MTAVALMQSGVDIIRMRHPKAVKIVRNMIDKLFGQ
jgi:CO dehydrogenase/acetyl-CoA synthase delta subunit